MTTTSVASVLEVQERFQYDPGKAGVILGSTSFDPYYLGTVAPHQASAGMSEEQRRASKPSLSNYRAEVIGECAGRHQRVTPLKISVETWFEALLTLPFLTEVPAVEDLRETVLIFGLKITGPDSRCADQARP